LVDLEGGKRNMNGFVLNIMKESEKNRKREK